MRNLTRISLQPFVPIQKSMKLFEWIKKNEYLQYKANRISDLYNNIEEEILKSFGKRCLLLSCLNPSYFIQAFFTLFISGVKAFLRNSSEIISLILRDESIHGVAVGFFAQNIFKHFS